jgi:hypothetical protein
MNEEFLFSIRDYAVFKGVTEETALRWMRFRPSTLLRHTTVGVGMHLVHTP